MNYDDIFHMADQERKRRREEGDMSELKRYHCTVLLHPDKGATVEPIVEHPNGDYYRVDEVDAEIVKLRSENERLKAAKGSEDGQSLNKENEVARLREENAKMGALLERFQVGIQMSGYSTDWQKHLYDDIETERYLDGSMPRGVGDASGRPNKDTDVAEGAVEATESAAPSDADESSANFVQVGEPQPQGQSVTVSAELKEARELLETWMSIAVNGTAWSKTKKFLEKGAQDGQEKTVEDSVGDGLSVDSAGRGDLRDGDTGDSPDSGPAPLSKPLKPLELSDAQTLWSETKAWSAEIVAAIAEILECQLVGLYDYIKAVETRVSKLDAYREVDEPTIKFRLNKMQEQLAKMDERYYIDDKGAIDYRDRRLDFERRINDRVEDLAVALEDRRVAESNTATWMLEIEKATAETKHILGERILNALEGQRRMQERIEALENEAANKTTTRDLNERIDLLTDAVLAMDEEYVFTRSVTAKLRESKEGA